MRFKSSKMDSRALSSLLAVSLLVVTGCSSGGSSNSGDEQPKSEKPAPEKTPEKLEPVTITIFNNAGSIKQQMETFVKAPVEKKYPHITLEILYSSTGATLKDLVAANQAPDMVYGLLDDSQYKLMMDLAPLIAKNKFDVNAIKPRLWEYANYFTGTTTIQNIPFLTSQHVMYYNKGIFDKFGVAYPKDGMTWDETYELAKKMTRTENGIRYMGFNFRHVLNFEQAQLPMPYYDEKTDKAAINSELWKRYFDNFARFYKIPGNELTKGKSELSVDTLFYRDKTVAMYAAHPMLGTLIGEMKAGNDLNWDMVSLPYFPEAPKQGTAPNMVGIGITVASKHQTDAFRVLEVLSSEDVQNQKAEGMYSESVRVNDAKARELFGKGTPELANKNTGALYYNNYAPSRKPNEYNPSLKSIATSSFVKIVQDGADTNTALRQAEEEMNKKIAEVKAMK